MAENEHGRIRRLKERGCMRKGAQSPWSRKRKWDFSQGVKLREPEKLIQGRTSMGIGSVVGQWWATREIKKRKIWIGEEQTCRERHGHWRTGRDVGRAAHGGSLENGGIFFLGFETSWKPRAHFGSRINNMFSFPALGWRGLCCSLDRLEPSWDLWTASCRKTAEGAWSQQRRV